MAASIRDNEIYCDVSSELENTLFDSYVIKSDNNNLQNINKRTTYLNSKKNKNITSKQSNSVG